MKNLKRVLSLAVSTVMLFGMMVVGTGAANYADVDASNNLEAIEVLKAVGVMEGDDKGNFNPDQNVTRNEMAVIMCNLLDLKAGGTSPFTDVPAWAQPYVAACYNNGIMAGIGGDQFGGSNNLTAAQAGLMVMKALGYFGFQGEFGDDWKVATVKQATKIDLFDGMNVYTDEALTRDNVAKLVLNALERNVIVANEIGGLTVEGNGIVVNQKPSYTYTPAADNADHDYDGNTDNVLQLTEKLYGSDLRKNANTTDSYGRPATQWTYGTSTIKSAQAADLSYTEGKKVKEIYADLGKPSSAYIVSTDTAVVGDIVVDGGVAVTVGALNSSNTNVVGGNGALTEVYYDKNTGAANIVVINTYLAQASGDYNEKSEDLTIVDFSGLTLNDYTLSVDDFAVADYEDEDFILFTAVTSDGGSTYDVKTIETAEVVSDVKVSEFKASDYVVAGGTKYNYNENNAETINAAAHGNALITGTYSLQSSTYDLVLDASGYVIGAQVHNNEIDLGDYLFVTDFAQSGFEWLAKVVFADGTKETVVVSKAKATVGTLDDVAGEDTANAAPTTANKVAEGWFYTYDVNKSGEYELTAVAASDATYAASQAITNGAVNLAGAGSVGTSETVVIADGKVTVGIKNAPDVVAAPVWFLNDANGYTLWVFSKTAGSVTTDADELVYITSAAYSVGKDTDENTYYVFKAIVSGEATTVSVDASTDSLGAPIAVGLYAIGGYSDGYVDDTYFTAVASGTPSAAYKVATSVSALTYKNGTMNVTGSGDTGAYVEGEDMVIYTIDSSDNYAVKTINTGYIKNLALDGSETVYLVQESTTDTDIVAMYIILD